jgi:P-type Ca2+ transporter type 2B
LIVCHLPHPGDEPLISGLLWRNIIGQGVFQLGLMYALVTRGDAIFNVPAHASVDGPSVHYTIVFNIFVLLQLFNQVQLGSDVQSYCNVSQVQICR